MDDKYYTFRYSYAHTGAQPDSENMIRHIQEILALFDLKIFESQFTIGYHQFNSSGDETTPHWHLHFRGSKTISAYRKAFQRYADTDLHSVGRKGVKLYNLREAKEEHIQDIDRFFRYPFKMHHLCEIFLDSYFKDETKLELQMELAKTEFEETKHRLLEQRKKENDKTTTYDKFLKYVHDEKIKIESKRQCQIAIIQFYKKEKMSMNPKTIQGYVYTYLMIHELMTTEEFIELL